MYLTKPLRGVIFDLDGTLADTLPVCYAAFRAAFHRYVPERTFSDAEITSFFGPNEEGVIRQVVPPEHWAAAMAAFLEEYEAAHGACPHPFEGIDAVLDLLCERGVPIAVVTGKGAESAALSLQRLGLAERFVIVEAGSPKGNIKPQAIRKALNDLGLTPDTHRQVAYVGDAPSDITSAREVGLLPISVAWASTAAPAALEAMHPAALFHTVAAFTDWIRDSTALVSDAG